MAIVGGSPLGAGMAAIFVVSVVLAVAGWIYTDARTHARRGRPIEYSAGTLHLRTPAGWFVASLIMPELILPVYIDSRDLA
jgi:hypothetical protein